MTDVSRDFPDTTRDIVAAPDEGLPREWVEEWAPPAPIKLDNTDRTDRAPRRRTAPVWAPTSITLAAGDSVELLRQDADRVRVILTASVGGLAMLAANESDLRGSGRFPVPASTSAPLVLDGWTSGMVLRNVDDTDPVTVYVLTLSYPNAVPLLS